MSENLPWCHGLVHEVTVKEILVVVTAWRIPAILDPRFYFISLQNSAIGLVGMHLWCMARVYVLYLTSECANEDIYAVQLRRDIAIAIAIAIETLGE